MFSIKVADRHTYTHASTDNKGRLKVAAREPTITAETMTFHDKATSVSATQR